MSDASLGDLRAIVFDVAGTLYVSPEFDSLVDEQAEAAIARSRGCSMDEAGAILEERRKENVRLHGDKSKVRALEALGISREEFHGAVTALDPTPFLEGAPRLGAFFDELRSRCLKIGILSNFRRPLVAKILDLLEISSAQIDAIIGEDDGLPIKPSPIPFRTVCERLAVAPQDALFVGDSLSKDLAPAKSVGMRTVFVASGKPDGTIEAADYQVDDVRGVARLIANAST